MAYALGMFMKGDLVKDFTTAVVNRLAPTETFVKESLEMGLFTV
jgi:hypothetical protein